MLGDSFKSHEIALMNRKFHASQISHRVKNWVQKVTFGKCEYVLKGYPFEAKTAPSCVFGNFGGLKFNIFIFFTCEESERMRLFCKELVRFFSDVKNWYSIFTNVKNRYQFLTHVKKWYSIFTNRSKGHNSKV